MVFHNGSNYGYNFIINELVEEFEGQFKCVEKTTKRKKRNEENDKIVTLKIKLLDSLRFMSNSSSSLADSFYNLAASSLKKNAKIAGVILNTSHSIIAHWYRNV